MAVVIPRFLHTNLIPASSTLLTASSAEISHPLIWLRDQRRARCWRSELGWTIVAGVDDKIDFNRGGPKVATLDPGYYPSGAALAAAVVSALTVADATPVWSCSYTANKFTISTAAHAFTLLLTSGANLATAAWKELGYIASGGSAADTGSAISQLAANVSYQSRHWVGIDLGSALQPTMCAVLNHNSGTGGVYTIRRGSATSASFDTLAGGADVRVAFFAYAGQQNWTLVVDDCQNSIGYAEVGVFGLGAYGQPVVAYEQANPRSSIELSSVSKGASGAAYQVARAQAGSWDFSWSAVQAADLAILQALRVAVPVGKHWIFCRDAGNPTTTTTYGFIRPDSPVNEVPAGPGYTDVTFGFEESLA